MTASISIKSSKLPMAPDNQTCQNNCNGNQAQVMTTSSTSNNSNCISENKSTAKTTPSPGSCSDNENKDFLIDDDYNDQQELTFYGHDDSADESIFEKMDSLLLRRQEAQEKDQNNEEIPNLDVETDGPIKTSVHPSPIMKFGEFIEDSTCKSHSRCGSLDTLSGQESIRGDDCMLDLEER